MSNIILQVTYGGVTKKITCTKSQSVNQAVEMAMAKFLLDAEAYSGKLVYQKKTLDASLPLRFTSLVNNSKVSLTAVATASKGLGVSGGTSVANAIDIKLVVSGYPTPKPQYLKTGITTDILLKQVLDLFEDENADLNLTPGDPETYAIELVLVNQRIPQTQFASTKLGSVVGSGVRSLALRLMYTNTKSVEEKEKQQQEIVRAQLEQQKLANAKRFEEERVLRDEQKEELKRQRLLEENLKQAEEYPDNGQMPQSQVDQPQTASSGGLNEVGKTSRDIRRNSADHPSVPSEQETRRINPAIEADRAAKTQLYKPGTLQTPIYENPDDDYEMTESQAKQYYKIVQSSGKVKSATKDAKQVSHYSIRLRFPDRTIIQFNYEESELAALKFGTLLRQVDLVLLPEFVNRYEIKLPIPPFKAIPMTFDNNNKLLVDFPEFQSERILLLWELSDSKSRKGPYVKQDSFAIVKETHDMPEVVIEENRPYLADDQDTNREPSGSSSQSLRKSLDGSLASSSSTKSGKLLPRWMQLNRK